MYPHHVFDLEPAGIFRMYPICYQWVSGRYFQPEPAMYSRCFCWFPGPLAPSGRQLVSVVGTSIYHSMADVQYTVRSNCGSGFGYPLINPSG